MFFDTFLTRAWVGTMNRRENCVSSSFLHDFPSDESRRDRNFVYYTGMYNLQDNQHNDKAQISIGTHARTVNVPTDHHSSLNYI